MRITFVAFGWEQLGISLLSAIAKSQGHDVRLAFSASLFHDRYNFHNPRLAAYFDDRKDVIATIERQQPDVLAFSPLTATYQWMLGIAQEVKELLPDVQVIFGGVHTSAVPDSVLAQSCVDYVCIGEGDRAFQMILKAIEEGGPAGPIVNTRYKLPDGRIVQGPQSGFIQDLDALPIFDKPLWEEHIRIGDWYLTMASRGCPYRCTFCFNNFFARLPQEESGRYVRHRSVSHVLGELCAAKRRYKLRFIEFEDDVFTVDKKWVKEFLSRYKKEIGVPFQCLTHPQYMDEELARWLSEAGCRYVQMGIQSLDEEFKYRVIKRYERNTQIERALEAMRKYNLRPKVDHMFGLPGEPLEAQETAREFYARHPPYRIQTFWTNFLPGTEMIGQAQGMGLITTQDIRQLNAGLEGDFYRNSGRIQDSHRRKIYKAYEVLFKLIPVLPGFMRRRLQAKHIAWLPIPLCSWMGFMADLLAGLMKGNPDHLIYARHYLYHILRFLVKIKMGKGLPPASRCLSAWSYPPEADEYVPRREPPVRRTGKSVLV
ncbi:MAG: hypothetical protein A3G91_06375 [Omnitrophica WOR_2 bacterium RIFCSPLOWO2_12_FULL_50_9]|nr:MAG: hypothetical protein A3D87_07635 [Omnitrophica WOR_2 bacterium RIFCSPHIGHO2_02_FULL_50_17]OGX41380.1 MAG: hypothetical protein A3G91_06375 [Omnitrophica WOR_2 bacterium RIFCSPLOWO2_12_FULL_50_9]